jgi:hypothetical protein
MRRAFFFAALLAASAASAQQYKWVDQNGKVQYGDRPPTGVQATPLKPPSGPSTAGAPSTGAAAGKKDGKALTPEQAFQKRQQDERDRVAKAEKEKSEAANKKYNCEQARANMRNLDTGRVSQTDAQGERVFLDDAQIAQQRERARQALSDWCN